MEQINLTIIVLLSILSFTAARTPTTKGDDLNDIKNETDEYDLESCKLSALPPQPNTMCCGVDATSSNRILGGEPTALKQYPWMALVEYQNRNNKFTVKTKCAGSLISGLYVLTAAHCVAGGVLEKFIPINVVLGDYDRTHDGPDCLISNGMKICTEGELRIPINNIKVHPEYNNKIHYNDIALIKLSKMAPYTDAIRPICLPSKDFTKDFKGNLWLDVAGWGVMRQNLSEKKISSVKRHVHVPLRDTEMCHNVWAINDSIQICAGGKAGKDACIGDSGGPLMSNNRGQYEAVGVVSYGFANPCGSEGFPTIYTKVHRYKTWIVDQIMEMESF